MFLFTEDCILGVEEIDEEHRHLFEMLNKCLDMLDNEYIGDQYSEIKELLDELEDYADEHFAHEEAYMKKIRDPELILQRPQHAMFEEKIMEFTVKNIDDDEQQHEALVELVNFLAKWLYRHILSSDMMIGKLPPLEEWMLRDNPCEFTEEYLTGIEIIDKEHKILFDIVGRADKLAREWSPGEKYDDIIEIIEELKEYTKVHFADEEEYMLGISYEGYDAQKRAHDAFIARLDDIQEEQMKEDTKNYLHSLIIFLIGWLINHILKADKQIPKTESEH